jgi:DnaJ-class molecular chaperone
MPRRNLYIVLGVPPGASAERIRSAYRTLAKAYHPDRIGPGGTSQFREISEAYRVLSDPVLRDAHNAALREERSPAEPTGRWGPGGIEPLVAEPIVVRRNVHTSRPSVEEEFLDWTMRNFIARHIPKSGYQRDADIEVILTPEEAALGGILPIEVPAFSICSACGGSGHDWFSFCAACGGVGVREGRRTARLQIPRLIRDGTTWEIPVTAGGLHLRIRIRIDPFSR